MVWIEYSTSLVFSNDVRMSPGPAGFLAMMVATALRIVRYSLMAGNTRAPISSRKPTMIAMITMLNTVAPRWLESRRDGIMGSALGSMRRTSVGVESMERADATGVAE